MIDSLFKKCSLSAERLLAFSGEFNTAKGPIIPIDLRRLPLGIIHLRVRKILKAQLVRQRVPLICGLRVPVLPCTIDHFPHNLGTVCVLVLRCLYDDFLVAPIAIGMILDANLAPCHLVVIVVAADIHILRYTLRILHGLQHLVPFKFHASLGPRKLRLALDSVQVRIGRILVYSSIDGKFLTH